MEWRRRWEAVPSMAIPKDVLILYDNQFRQKFGAKAPIGGKEAAIAKWLVSQYSQEQVGDWLKVFFDSPDPFIRQSGYSLGVFKACLPKVIAAASRQQPVVKGHVCTACKMNAVEKFGNYCETCREARL
jgi:hypothetical protein